MPKLKQSMSNVLNKDNKHKLCILTHLLICRTNVNHSIEAIMLGDGYDTCGCMKWNPKAFVALTTIH